MKHYLTFDIEDNFELEELSNPVDWANYESQVVDNTKSILALLRNFDTKATFFVLGKVAERHPSIVEMIISDGHKLGSHGYAHRPVAALGKEGFDLDLLRSMEILKTISGNSIEGFRAMGFSVTGEVPWALQAVKEAGFSYDSSILSTRLNDFPSSKMNEVPIKEVPVNSVSIFGKTLTLGGGIFFRLVPHSVIRRIVLAHEKKGKPFMIYLHAWEFNRDQPQRKVGFLQRLAQSPRTFTGEKKLRLLLNNFKFGPI